MSQGIHEGNDSIMNLLASFFQKNPYASMRDVYQHMQDYITPYTNAGLEGLGQLSGLVKDPTALEDSIDAKYKESPYAQYQSKQLADATNAAAAASGTLGTPQEQQEMAAHLQGLISRDQQQYRHDAMQPYEFGVGNELGAGKFGTNLENAYLENMANLAGGKDQWKNSLTQSQFGDVGEFLNSFGDVGLGGAQAFMGMFGGGMGGMI
jgi:hypothetical protein